MFWTGEEAGEELTYQQPEGIPAPGVNFSATYNWIDLVSLIPPEIVIHPRYIPQEPQLNQKLAGRLLTPQEGCGSNPGKRAMHRVVGGSVAQNGKLKIARVRQTVFIELFQMCGRSDIFFPY